LYTKWHFAVEKAKIKRIEKRLDKKHGFSDEAIKHIIEKGNIYDF